MTYTEFLSAVRTLRAGNPDWRQGQTYFNALHRVRPDLAEKVRGSELDPFHSDDRIPGFLTFVSNRWDVAA